MHQYYTPPAAKQESKVPAVTLGFWIIKVLATTLGETGGDAVTMSMNLGYLAGTGIFAAIFAAAVTAQLSARRFHPFLYWAVIVATTTVGTTLADFVDRSLGIGYLGGSSLLAALLVASLVVWHRTMGTVSIASINSKKAEAFYWITIMFSQTLGTALGDWMADSTGTRLRRRRAGICGGDRAHRGSLFLDQGLANRAVLDCLRADQAARCHGRRLPRQAARPRRAGAEPLHGFRRISRRDRAVAPDHSAAIGGPPGLIRERRAARLKPGPGRR